MNIIGFLLCFFYIMMEEDLCSVRECNTYYEGVFLSI